MVDPGWGTERYGIDAWGGGIASSQVISALVPDVVEVRGGTVVKVVGVNFFDTFVLQILSGDPLAPVLEGSSFMFDTRYDLQSPDPNGAGYKQAYVGLPPLPAGVYHVRAVIRDVVSVLLEDALEYKLFAEQYKIQKVRSGYGSRWLVGERVLTTAIAGGIEP